MDKRLSKCFVCVSKDRKANVRMANGKTEWKKKHTHVLKGTGTFFSAMLCVFHFEFVNPLAITFLNEWTCVNWFFLFLPCIALHCYWYCWEQRGERNRRTNLISFFSVVCVRIFKAQFWHLFVFNFAQMHYKYQTKMI